MKVQKVNKTGLVLRFVAIPLLVYGLVLFLGPIVGSIIYPDVSEEFDKRGFDGAEFAFSIAGLLLIGFSALLFLKTQRSLRILRFITVVGAPLFALAVFATSALNGTLWHPLLWMFYLPLYVLTVILALWLISIELSKMTR